MQGEGGKTLIAMGGMVRERIRWFDGSSMVARVVDED
jgi:hypothetical protein